MEKQNRYDIDSSPIGYELKHLRHKIYFSVNGEGYGHSSRVLAIARQFNKDEVILGSYGYVLERLEKSLYPTVEIDPEISFVGSEGNFDIGRTILKNTAWPVAINRLINEEKKIIQNYGITCVVADSRSAAVFAANKLGIPCILLTNQTTFAPFFEVEIKDLEDSLIEKSFKEWLRAGTQVVLTATEPFALRVIRNWLNASDEIFIPDLPPPYSLCLPLLCTESFVKKKQRFIGPLLSWDPRALKEEEHGYPKKVVCTLGGHKYRKPLFDVMLLLAKQMPNIQFTVLSDFKSDLKLPNLELVGFVDNPAQYYLNSDLVITQAGHSTAMELITLGLPMLVIPDTRQVEQEANAKRLCEMGLATSVSYKDLHPEILSREINFMLNAPSFKLTAEKMSKIAKNYIAGEEAARVIRDYSTRVQVY